GPPRLVRPRFLLRDAHRVQWAGRSRPRSPWCLRLLSAVDPPWFRPLGFPAKARKPQSGVLGLREFDPALPKHEEHAAGHARAPDPVSSMFPARLLSTI